MEPRRGRTRRPFQRRQEFAAQRAHRNQRPREDQQDPRPHPEHQSVRGWRNRSRSPTCRDMDTRRWPRKPPEDRIVDERVSARAGKSRGAGDAGRFAPRPRTRGTRTRRDHSQARPGHCRRHQVRQAAPRSAPPRSNVSTRCTSDRFSARRLPARVSTSCAAESCRRSRGAPNARRRDDFRSHGNYSDLQPMRDAARGDRFGSRPSCSGVRAYRGRRRIDRRHFRDALAHLDPKVERIERRGPAAARNRGVASRARL